MEFPYFHLGSDAEDIFNAWEEREEERRRSRLPEELAASYNLPNIDLTDGQADE